MSPETVRRIWIYNGFVFDRLSNQELLELYDKIQPSGHNHSICDYALRILDVVIKDRKIKK